MSDLRDSIQSLAQTFAAGVLQAIRSASLADILAESPAPRRGPGRPPSKGAPGRPPAASASKRLARRSEKDLAAVADSIVTLVKKHDKGLRAEQIRSQLGIAKKEWARPLEAALASKKLTKKGEKRATTYFSTTPFRKVPEEASESERRAGKPARASRKSGKTAQKPAKRGTGKPVRGPDDGRVAKGPPDNGNKD